MSINRPTRPFRLIAALALFAALGAPAHADVEKGTGEFGLDFGFTEFDSAIGGNGPRLAARLGYYFTDVIGLEAMVCHSDSSDNDGVSAELTAAYANAVVNVPVKRNLVPYFLVGVGGAELDTGVADDTGVTMQALGGARFFGQQGKVGIRFEAGLVWVDAFDEDTTHWNLNVGLTWTIGGPHPHDAPDKWGSWGR
jgi:hypothetical protein